MGTTTTNEGRKWTRDGVFNLLMTNDKAVGRALVSLLEEQTHDEQVSEDTFYQNGRGFTKADAEVMTSMAKFFKKTGFLTPKQLSFLRSGKSKRYPSRIGKYAAQLASKVNRNVV